MPLKSIALDTLDRIVTAPNAPQVGEAALAAVKELVAADYYSAITHDLKTGATDLFHPGEGWLGPAHALVQTILRTQDEHPFVQHFFPRGQSAVYRRSDLLPDRQWQLTEAFNEVDRTLGIRDMVAIYQITAAGQLLVLTVGRSGQFRAADLESVRKLQRILSVLPVARPAPVSLVPLPPQARHSQADLLPVWAAGSRLIPAGQSGVLVQPSEILCITADGNCSTILTADQRTIKVRQTLAGWRALLPVGTFLQTDRATLINLRHIGRVEFSAHSASVHFDVPVPALDLGRNAAQKLKWAMQLNKRTPTTNIRHPTTNTQQPRTRVCAIILCWAFEVGCWMLTRFLGRGSLESGRPSSPRTRNAGFIRQPRCGSADCRINPAFRWWYQETPGAFGAGGLASPGATCSLMPAVPALSLSV